MSTRVYPSGTDKGRIEFQRWWDAVGRPHHGLVAYLIGLNDGGIVSDEVTAPSHEKVRDWLGGVSSPTAGQQTAIETMTLHWQAPSPSPEGYTYAPASLWGTTT